MTFSSNFLEWKCCILIKISLNSRHLKSLATQQFVQQFIHTNNKGYIKALHYSARDQPVIGAFPSQRDSNMEWVSMSRHHHDKVQHSTALQQWQRLKLDHIFNPFLWRHTTCASYGESAVSRMGGDEGVMMWLNWVPFHDDIIKWKHFPHYWPFVWGIHQSPVNSQHKGQWQGALMFSLICTWTNSWVNNREAGHLRCHRAHYDVTVMPLMFFHCNLNSMEISFNSHHDSKTGIVAKFSTTHCVKFVGI